MNRNTKNKNTLNKLNTWWFQTISIFWDQSILLQDVSLEYDISHWNKTKQTDPGFVDDGRTPIL